MRRRSGLTGVIWGAALLLAPCAFADCRLALALAFDVSNSVGAADYAIQHQGLLAALADPEIRHAILDPPDPVALALYEWSGRDHQLMIVDWTVMRTAGDLDAVMAQIRTHQRDPRRWATALGRALIFGRALMDAAPPCVEQVLDMSGDGANNDSTEPWNAYASRDFGALRVNGLAILSYEPDVAEYYRDHVIRGRGAFVEIAEGQEDFPRAIRRKLLRELTEQVVGMDAGAAGRAGG